MPEPKHTPLPETRRLLEACRSRQASHYGARLAGVVLYGSARSVPADAYEQGATQRYRNARAEGLAV